MDVQLRGCVICANLEQYWKRLHRIDMLQSSCENQSGPVKMAYLSHILIGAWKCQIFISIPCSFKHLCDL